MRVMQVMSGARFGGAEVFFVRLVLALHRSGLAQRIVMRSDERRQKILSGAGLEPVQLPFGGLLDSVTRRSIRHAVADYRPDIILCWMNRAARYAPTGDHVLIGRMGGYYNLKYYRHCDHIIGNTVDIVENVVQRGWPTQQAHYLPNFVDLANGATVSRNEFDTPIDVPLLLALGRLHQNKGFDVLLQALKRLSGVYLWIVGDGPERQSLNSLAKRLRIDDRVRFLGWREDALQFISSADVVVSPSRYEPLGNVILEAWAASRPVVATAAAGPRSLIDDGRSGRLVPIDDPVSLASTLDEVMTDTKHARAIAREGHARYLANHSEHVVVSKYLDFFKRMVKLCAASQA